VVVNLTTLGLSIPGAEETVHANSGFFKAVSTNPAQPPWNYGFRDSGNANFLTTVSIPDGCILADALLCPITLKKGLTGAKPEGFCGWVLDLLNVQPGDELVDMYVGTGVMGDVMTSRYPKVTTEP
jgi:hypothetical protein